MNKINLELQIPSQWKEELQKLADKNNQSLPEFTREIIGQYLAIKHEKLQQKQIKGEIEALKNRVKTLEEKDYQIEKITNKYNILEKLIASLQTQIFTSKTINENSIIEDDDDIEDEPDEILTDFFPH